jgi:geranylgeranyl diphosphate synthase type II
MTDRRLARLVRPGEPRALNDACVYVLTGGGKRIRSILVMLGCEAVGGSARAALEAGAAVEIVHNFTLVHDDIMDRAPSRRGRPTVHVRWDLNTSLLAGDVLLGIAYRTLLRTRTPETSALVRVFTEGVLDVCEGQAFDVAYERTRRVTVAQYFRMIEKKTGRLVSMAAELGGIVGGASAVQRRALRRFGLHLGRAFQLQDDLLDVVADEKRFGKSIGGDIAEGKKTFLLLTAARRTRGADRTLLERVLRQGARKDGGRDEEIIRRVREIYTRTGVLDDARGLVRRSTTRAHRSLDRLPATRGTATLHWLADALVDRPS